MDSLAMHKHRGASLDMPDVRSRAKLFNSTRSEIPVLHDQALGVQTSGTLERAFVVAGFVWLKPFEPHHATTFKARWVFQVIDKPVHRKIKARTAPCVDCTNLTHSLGN